MIRILIAPKEVYNTGCHIIRAEAIISDDRIDIVVFCVFKVTTVPRKQESHLLACNIIGLVKERLASVQKWHVFIIIPNLQCDAQRCREFALPLIETECALPQFL
jgi:hypothetical protein